MKSEVRINWFENRLYGGESKAVQDILLRLKSMQVRLADYSVEMLLNAFSDFSNNLMSRANPLLNKYPASGVPFLGRWCRRENLANLLIDALGSLECLDQFVPRKRGKDRLLRAFSRGVVVHWIAGNVPTLGLLSLIPGLLTKNVNIVRIPSNSDMLLADLMWNLSQQGEVGMTLAGCVAVIRYDYNKERVGRDISSAADVRIIWGGDESTFALKNLPVKPTCIDMVFPHRTSFALVGKSVLKMNRIERVARLIAYDVSVFEQKACASPHTVFVSTKDWAVLKHFCSVLAEAMGSLLKRLPKKPPSHSEVQAILNLRCHYDMFYDAWYSGGTEFTILLDDLVQIGPAIGNRTVYVRPLPTLKELAAILPENVQSVGIEADEKEFGAWTESLGALGVHRFTPLGAMTDFEIPWDGLKLPQQLVRWTTRQYQ